MPSQNQTKISFIVLSDNHRSDERGKIDCFGIFNIMNVWATPAHREFSFVFGLSDLSNNEEMKIWLRDPNDKVIELATLKISQQDIDKTALFNIISARRFSVSLNSIGRHEVGMGLSKSPKDINIHWVPLLVNLLPWPSIPNGDELTKILKDPHAIKASRAIVSCKRCKTEYIFEINLIPGATLSEGALPFPPNGTFSCTHCSMMHYLRDIEGQVRSQLGRSTKGA